MEYSVNKEWRWRHGNHCVSPVSCFDEECSLSKLHCFDASSLAYKKLILSASSNYTISSKFRTELAMAPGLLCPASSLNWDPWYSVGHHYIWNPAPCFWCWPQKIFVESDIKEVFISWSLQYESPAPSKSGSPWNITLSSSMLLRTNSTWTSAK